MKEKEENMSAPNKSMSENYCMACGVGYIGDEPKMCCSGRECGCMGMPIEPLVCSKECSDKGNFITTFESDLVNQTKNLLK
ncbi:MAG: hypothetical protein V4549_06590 [Bacteroidota bacterium]